MKILSIFGTRPEAIKMAPVVRELQRHQGAVKSKICVTGQHRAMLDQVMQFFNIRPDYDLNLMQKQQSLAHLTTQTIIGLEPIFEEFKPDWVLVQGDTTTAFVSALAAFYKQIKIAHIEAGLRTHNLYSPWPEEANRHLLSVITNMHYAPTAQAVEHLLAENINASTIVNTGNTVIDALKWASHRIDNDPTLYTQLTSQFSYLNFDKRLILVTGHRRESWDSGLSRVFHALRDIAAREDVEIIYPVHLNPRVQIQAKKILHGIDNVFLIDPIDYVSLVYLLKLCYVVVTDSGGIQEEAPTFGKPVLVTRDTTERPEAIKVGSAKLVGTDSIQIKQALSQLLEDPMRYQQMTITHNPYGDGHASERIVTDLLSRHKVGSPTL